MQKCLCGWCALGILRFCLFYNISLTFNDGGLWLGGGGLSGLAGEDEGLPVFSFFETKEQGYSLHLGWIWTYKYV